MKPNFIHYSIDNHAGHAFHGNATALAYYWVNRNNECISKEWCINQIKRSKSRNRRKSKVKYNTLKKYIIKSN